MLDDGTSAVGAYAIYSSSNAPIRLLVINTNYYDGSGTRSIAAVSFTGLTASQSSAVAKRMTAPSAASRVDAGDAITIGGSASFTSSCTETGGQTTETVTISGTSMTVSVRASEALIVFL